MGEDSTVVGSTVEAEATEEVEATAEAATAKTLR